ncbi:MAG: helix-turn-helix domain-containing protein [Alphaproteobacteria bacterium]|nr:helix-turn-helix domain-containing protein [Alphaproteobacteria bacterium]
MDDRSARAAAARTGSPYLNTPQAAYYLGFSQRTLERMRTLGIGPAFRKHGHQVRYLIDELDRWSVKQERHSTSEYAELTAATAHS